MTRNDMAMAMLDKTSHMAASANDSMVIELAAQLNMGPLMAYKMFCTRIRAMCKR